VLSGTDVECGNNFRALKKALEEGKIDVSSIDQAVTRLLKARFELGMFDPDSLVSWASIPLSVVGCEEHKVKALEMARKSMVLLKNSNQTLPLSKTLKKVAVVGPNAADSTMLWANYNGFPLRTVTILEGIQKKLPEGAVLYEKGCDHVATKFFNSGFNECSSNGKTGFSATYYNTRDFSGDLAAMAQVSAPFNFNTGGNTVFAPGVALNNFSAKYTAVFKPSKSGEVVFRIGGTDGYRLKIDGKEAAADWGDHFPTRKEYLLQAEQGKSYAIEIEYYKGNNNNATLNFDLGRVEETDFNKVAAKVADADVIVFVGGISPRLEGEEMRVDFPGFRGGDRTDIELPQVQRNLLKALKATGKPVVFVLCAGSAMAVTWENEHLDAILNAWYAGQEGGTAVADVLFGDYNPAGRLPLTFYSSVSQIPDFEDYNMNKGRTYRYFQGKPLYPFGYGLSYTTFSYSGLKCPKSVQTGNIVPVTFRLKNNGSRDGDEVIQLYIRNLQDPEGPLHSLRTFRRVSVKAGKTEKIKFALSPESFEFFNPATKTTEVLPGNYEILCGGSSDERSLQKIMVRIK